MCTSPSRSASAFMRSTNFCSFSARRSATAVAASFAEAIATAASNVSNGMICPVASPMRKSEYLLAQLIARLAFLPAEVLVPLLFAMIAFGMPVNGSAAAIVITTLAGTLSFGAIGLLLATRARTIEAISGLMNLVMLPMWILSGVFFSSANFPDAVQPVIHALPLTAQIDALRAIILDGATLADVKSELAVLGIWGVVPFFAALRLFSWK